MKYSQFNSIIPYREQFALYNTFENKVIFLLPELKEILNSAVKEDINILQNIHPDFYGYLSKNKFLVKDKTDELEKVKKLSFKIDNRDTIYELIINPTVNCNFHCWYCYETHEKSKMNCDTINRVNEFILKTVQNEKLKYLSLAFFGGEPLLYFKDVVVPIIEKAMEHTKKYNKKLGIGFTTNGSLISEEFIEFFKEKQIKPHFQITLDGYRENHDKVRYISKSKGSYFTIINNIKKLVENKMFVRARINYTEDNLEDTYKILT